MRAAAALALLTGCNLLLGLEPAQVADRDGGGGVDAAGGDHDEDGDDVPDGVDVCPHLFDDQSDELELQAGSDADGVGDACDPHPLAPGDRFVVFDGFGGGALADRWQTTSVILADDRAVLSDPDLTLAHLTWQDPAAPDEELFLLASIEIVAYLAQAEDFVRLVTHYSDTDRNGIQAYSCDVVDHPGDAGNGRVLLQRFQGGLVSPLAMTPRSKNAPSGLRTLSLLESYSTVDGAVEVACNDDAGGVPITAAAGDGAPLAQGQVGVRAYGMEVGVAWIVAIAGPRP